MVKQIALLLCISCWHFERHNTQQDINPYLRSNIFSNKPLRHLEQIQVGGPEEMVAKAEQLSHEEERLKQRLSLRRREVLAQKRLVLFKWLLEKSGSIDTELFSDLCSGFDLTGTLPESNTFAKRFRPAHLPADVLRGVAKTARTTLFSSVKGSGESLLDSGVYDATLKELDKGFLIGPVDLDTLPEGATLTRRFGVRQKEKIRPIDAQAWSTPR